MKVFAIARPTEGTTFEDMGPVLPYEARHAWELHAGDVLREVYLRTDALGAVVVIEADSLEAAERLLADFPLVRAGLLWFEAMTVGAFQPWEMLFATSKEDG